MSLYSKETWIDRVVEFPHNYLDEHSELKTFVPSPGVITEAGTDITAARMNNIENGIDRAEGWYADPVRWMQNTKDICDCEAAWANKAWSLSAGGSYSLESSIVKVGLGAAKLTASNADDGIHIIKALALDEFENTSASATADYICFITYIDSTSYGRLAAQGYAIRFLCDAEGTTTNQYRYSITKAMLVNGDWACIYIAKSEFTGYGAPSWDAITGISFEMQNNAVGGSVSVIIDAIRMVRKDPISATPNPFQQCLNGTWTRELAINAGDWYIGIVVCRNLIPSSTTYNALCGVKSYTSFVANARIEILTINDSIDIVFYIDGANMFRGRIDALNDILYLSTKTAGGAWVDVSVSMNVSANTIADITLIKIGTSVSIIVYLDNDINTPYTLATTFTPTTAGYLAVGSCEDVYFNLLALSITTSLHSDHCNVAERANAIGELTQENCWDLVKVKYSNSSFTDNDTAQTFTDTFCTAASLVTIYNLGGTPRGAWTVESFAGYFTITSTLAESADITFNYKIERMVIE